MEHTKNTDLSSTNGCPNGYKSREEYNEKFWGNSTDIKRCEACSNLEYDSSTGCNTCNKSW